MSEIFLQLQQNPLILITALFVLGACIGSFLNVVALRLPPLLFHQWKTQCLESLDQDALPQQPDREHVQSNLIRPGSRCPNCLQPLKMGHNIPVLSYLLLAGKCAFCKEPISIRYPIIEVVSGMLCAYLGFVFGIEWQFIFALGFVYTLLALSIIDFDHQILPDILVLPLLWAGLIANSFSLFTDLQSAVIGAICGYLVLWFIYQVHHKITGKEGMGYGDFKLLAAIGAWFGWEILPVVVLLASISGTVIAVIFIITGKHARDVPIPFGPYLAIAAFASLIWGDTILSNYLTLFNL